MQREKSTLERIIQQKGKSLDDSMQALSVEMQDYENEEDALQVRASTQRHSAGATEDSELE